MTFISLTNHWAGMKYDCEHGGDWCRNGHKGHGISSHLLSSTSSTLWRPLPKHKWIIAEHLTTDRSWLLRCKIEKLDEQWDEHLNEHLYMNTSCIQRPQSPPPSSQPSAGQQEGDRGLAGNIASAVSEQTSGDPPDQGSHDFGWESPMRGIYGAPHSHMA